ncbi:PilN domain-containing protein [Pseudaeromonas paramecii]|uniref:MSHA fimbrial biogenesis protein MshI1 n=1 Tax=Pseudaeromonas paramecii TaxID=2138166 RepID=A0ABP8QLD0_9GAMM
MKLRVNLYTDEFRPKRQWLSLPQMMLGWLGLLALLLAWWGLSHWQLSQQQQANRQLQQQLMQLKQQSDGLDAQIKARQQDAGLTAELANRRALLAGKQQLVSRLNGQARLKSQGMAGLLADLARVGSPDIAVQRIRLDEGRLSLAGESRSSEAVPAWLDRFKQTQSLAGQGFADLQMQRDDAGRLHFELNARTGGKSK